MTEEFLISKGSDFLRVQTSRTISPSGIHSFLSPVLAEARDAGVSKVLVDGRITRGTLSTVERFEYGSWIAENFGGLRVAFVLHESVRDPHLFGEAVALNRGGNMRVFIDLKEAYEWLEINPDNHANPLDTKS